MASFFWDTVYKDDDGNRMYNCTCILSVVNCRILHLKFICIAVLVQKQEDWLLDYKKMLGDPRLLLLTTVACFQLCLTVDPAGLSYTDLKDQQPSDALLRSYVASRLIATPSLHYYDDEGVYNISLLASSSFRLNKTGLFSSHLSLSVTSLIVKINDCRFWTRKRVPSGHERCCCCCACSWGCCYQTFNVLELFHFTIDCH